jgi:hypothetical protein
MEHCPDWLSDIYSRYILGDCFVKYELYLMLLYAALDALFTQFLQLLGNFRVLFPFRPGTIRL